MLRAYFDRSPDNYVYSFKMLTEDLMTIIDFMDQMNSLESCTFWDSNKTSPSGACLDAHDFAHYLMGGDRVYPWHDMKEMVMEKEIVNNDGNPVQVWPDIRTRMKEILTRLGEISED